MPQGFPTRQTNLAAASLAYDRRLVGLEGQNEPPEGFPDYVVEKVFGDVNRIGFAALLKPDPDDGRPSILAIRGSDDFLSATNSAFTGGRTMLNQLKEAGLGTYLASKIEGDPTFRLQLVGDSQAAIDEAIANGLLNKYESSIPDIASRLSVFSMNGIANSGLTEGYSFFDGPGGTPGPTGTNPQLAGISDRVMFQYVAHDTSGNPITTDLMTDPANLWTPGQGAVPTKYLPLYVEFERNGTNATA